MCWLAYMETMATRGMEAAGTAHQKTLEILKHHQARN